MITASKLGVPYPALGVSVPSFLEFHVTHARQWKDRTGCMHACMHTHICLYYKGCVTVRSTDSAICKIQMYGYAFH